MAGVRQLLCSMLLLWVVATLGWSRTDPRPEYHSSHTNNWAVLVRKGKEKGYEMHAFLFLVYSIAI